MAKRRKRRQQNQSSAAGGESAPTSSASGVAELPVQSPTDEPSRDSWAPPDDGTSNEPPPGTEVDALLNAARSACSTGRTRC